jgi:FMN phosphatase YigB (HAD superfamily)
MGANRCGIRAVWLNERGSETRVGEMYRTIHDFRDLPRALDELRAAP